MTELESPQPLYVNRSPKGRFCFASSKELYTSRVRLQQQFRRRHSSACLLLKRSGIREEGFPRGHSGETVRQISKQSLSNCQAIVKQFSRFGEANVQRENVGQMSTFLEENDNEMSKTIQKMTQTAVFSR